MISERCPSLKQSTKGLFGWADMLHPSQVNPYNRRKRNKPAWLPVKGWPNGYAQKWMLSISCWPTHHPQAKSLYLPIQVTKHLHMVIACTDAGLLHLPMQPTKQYFQVTASTQHAYSQPEYSHRQATNTPQLIGTISEGHFD